MSIVVVSPHVDDAELGMLSLLRPGVTVVVLTYDRTRAVEARASAVHFGHRLVLMGETADQDGRLVADRATVTAVEAELVEAEVVLSPPWDDVHQDHAAVARIADAATRRSGVTLMEYETASARASWAPDTYVVAEPDALAAAVHALPTLFPSQGHGPYLSPAFLLARSRLRGYTVGVDGALAFRTVRRATSGFGEGDAR